MIQIPFLLTIPSPCCGGIEREIDLRFQMRSVLIPLGSEDEWGEWILGAEVLAREIKDDARLSNVLNYLSSLHWIHDQPRKAIEIGQKALTLASKANHFSCQVATMLHLGIFSFTSGEYAKQVEYHQEVRKRLTGTAAFLQHGLWGPSQEPGHAATLRLEWLNSGNLTKSRSSVGRHLK